MARASTQAAQALEQDRAPSPAVRSRSRTRPRSVAARPAPARSTRRVVPRTARPAERSTSTARVLKLRAVAPSPAGLLDRLVRGRGWVACVGLLLAGIVFLNVTVLEVNGGIANVSERATSLKRENADLRLRVAKLASSERIQAAAAGRGFSLPAPGAVTYLRAEAESDARHAARALERRPDAIAIAPPPAAATGDQGSQAAATDAAPATATPVADAPATPTTGDR